MIQFSTARSNRALAVALAALVKAQPRCTLRGRPRKGELRGVEYREVEAVKQMVRLALDLNYHQCQTILKRIDAEITKG